MKNTPKILIASLTFFITTAISAQTYSGFSDVSIILKSDSFTKSVLISNLLEDRVGDISPIIGAAAWIDNNKKLQCRSLLSFNYGILPKLIRPEQITQAQLILQPLELVTAESFDGSLSSGFIVRRILEPWEDSLTSWLTQPASNPGDEIIKSIRENKKGRIVKIDVTEIVKNMFRYGNNGFMIRYEDSLETTSFLSQWFASAKYENEKLRPQLLISCSFPVGSRYPNFNFAEGSPIPIDMLRGPTAYSAMYGSQQAVPAPVITNDPPPKTPPIKDKGSN